MSYEDEREIDVLDLLFYILQKWRVFILVGCIGFVLLGVFRYFTAEKARAENDALIAAGREEEVIYSDAYTSALNALKEQESAIYELNEQIFNKKNKINNLKINISNSTDSIAIQKESLRLLSAEKEEVARKLTELQHYMEKTVLLRINALSKPLAIMSFQVLYSGEETKSFFRDPTDEILSAYTQNISLINAGFDLSEQYNIPEVYLDELIAVWYDATSNIIYAQASGLDEQMAKDVLHVLCSVIESRKSPISNRYHTHILIPLMEEYRVIVDESLIKTQSSRYSTCNSYISQIATYDEKILKLNTSINNLNSIIAANEQDIELSNDILEDLQFEVLKIKKIINSEKLKEKVSAKAPSQLHSLKDGIKFGIIGAIIIAVLAAGCFFLRYFMDGKLHSESDLSNLTSLPVLAVLNRSGKYKNFIDKWLYNQRNKNLNLTDQAVLQIAAVSLARLIGEDKKVAILTSLSDDSLSNITAEFSDLLSSVTFVPVAGSTRSAASVSALSSVDAVLLCEQREVSSMSDIEAEFTQVTLLEKRILGVIIA